MKGQDVRTLLELVAQALRLDQDGDSSMIDYRPEEVEPEEESDDEPYEYDYEHYGAGQTNAAIIGRSIATAEFRERIRSDLRIAKEAGFKVGNCGAIMNGESCYLSISTRISKLGISEEAMQTWHVKPAQYLILVIFYPDGYQSSDAITTCDTSASRSNIVFRVGLSHTYKPTLEELTAMFKVQLLDKKETSNVHNDDDESAVEPIGWRNSFISRPLGELLNGRFVPILKLRYRGMPWAGAELYFHDVQGVYLDGRSAKHVDDKYLQDDLNHSKFPPMVTADHIQDARPNQLHSLPLLAMQFTLRHFVRSTEFCMVCHCRLENQLEALKPYVCDRGLCLYQYMSLGFGPSIEHEIITQPYVVDLLVSFCYTSAVSRKLKTLPTGLHLLVPNPQLISSVPPRSTLYAQPPASSQPQATLKFDRNLMELIYDKNQEVDLRVGDWVVVSPVTAPAIAVVGAPNTQLQHRRVASIFGSSVKLAEINDELKFLGDFLPQPTNGHIKDTSMITADDASGQMPVYVDKYDTNFDNLDAWQQQEVVRSQLKLLPRISQLREYLIQTKMATLSGWVDRLSPALVAILRWIIASNRACIMQVDKSPHEEGAGRIHGMGDWMQFRFAMGAPVCRASHDCIVVTDAAVGQRRAVLG
jgi:ubiquitin-conjugating enzyme E2 Q